MSDVTPPLYPWLYESANLLSAQHVIGRLHHALLFHGSEGLGKGALAEIIATGLLCFERHDLTHCGQCKSCLLVKAGNHPDLLSLEGSDKALGINDIRQINQFVEQMPLIAKRKVVVIKGLDKMTLEATNGLLKSMEEPNQHSYLLMCTNQIEKLLPTIVSRCFKMTISAFDRQQVFAWLGQTGVDVSVPQLARLYRLADEAPLKLLAFIEQDKVQTFLNLEQKFAQWQQGKLSLVAFKADVSDDDFALTTLRFLLHEQLKQQLTKDSAGDDFRLVSEIIAQLTAFSRDGEQIIGQNKGLALIRMLNQIDSAWHGGKFVDS